MAQQGPAGAADTTAPDLPSPGPLGTGDPLSLLAFAPGPSPCQAGGDQGAVGTTPGMAGPLATVPTTQMQDFGQVMGQTIVTSGAPDQQDR